MKDHSFSDVDGVRIRRQYFNYIILDVFLISLFFLLPRIFAPVFTGMFDFSEWLNDVGWSALNFMVLIIPFAVLSVVNIFCFGKIVCVMNEDGIYYGNDLIRWDDILYLKFESVEWGRFHYYPTYMTVVCKKRRLEITSAPLYMFFVAKKFKSDIRIKIGKTTLVTVGVIIALSVIAMFAFYYADIIWFI